MSEFNSTCPGCGVKEDEVYNHDTVQCEKEDEAMKNENGLTLAELMDYAWKNKIPPEELYLFYNDGPFVEIDPVNDCPEMVFLLTQGDVEWNEPVPYNDPEEA